MVSAYGFYRNFEMLSSKISFCKCRVNKFLLHTRLYCKVISESQVDRTNNNNVATGSSSHHGSSSSASPTIRNQQNFKDKLKNGPAFSDFVKQSVDLGKSYVKYPRSARIVRDLFEEKDSIEQHSYVKPADVGGNGRKVYFEVFGCQMNVNDTEIAWSILKKHGYVKVADPYLADVILVMTCSVRESAEDKVWKRLHMFKSYKILRSIQTPNSPVKIGVLGCMAERLKTKLLEKEKSVNVVAGPDSYRDLPRLLANVTNDQASVNVMLSYDETYADVMPVRFQPETKSAFVSIMRGCDNMCTYCIVPFTRGRERSRPIKSIVDEVQELSDQGCKEITLLGQNVNSYQDKSEGDRVNITNLSAGFKTIYKPKIGGLRFGDLLDRVSAVNPEIRIRFTSPHPKDFPDDVLHLIKERPNICKLIHLPAQSGNDRILELMRRGYSRDSYLKLVNHIRTIIPDVGFTSDFICGFVDETEKEFEDTLSLMDEVMYSNAFVFAFSVREKTQAYYRLKDNVPKHIKLERLKRMSDVFRKHAEHLNRKLINSRQLILVEGISKRSNAYLCGRTDLNTKVVFPFVEIPEDSSSNVNKQVKTGDYIVVLINDAGSQTLKGIPLFHSSIKSFDEHDELGLYNQAA